VDEPRSALFSIGHSHHALDAFLDLLRRHGIEVLADVRSQPYSRFVPHFRQELLPQSGCFGMPHASMSVTTDGTPARSDIAESRPAMRP
jgi:uncharacterized protein (DUF488 family)